VCRVEGGELIVHEDVVVRAVVTPDADIAESLAAWFAVAGAKVVEGFAVFRVEGLLAAFTIVDVDVPFLVGELEIAEHLAAEIVECMGRGNLLLADGTEFATFESIL
jgi:hypothetical protein